MRNSIFFRKVFFKQKKATNRFLGDGLNDGLLAVLDWFGSDLDLPLGDELVDAQVATLLHLPEDLLIFLFRQQLVRLARVDYRLVAANKRIKQVFLLETFYSQNQYFAPKPWSKNKSQAL